MTLMMHVHNSEHFISAASGS